MADQTTTVGVVIPAYNPCHRLARVISNLPPAVSVVVVVDDGSAIPIVAGHFGDAPAPSSVNLHILRHEINMGVGAAIVSGYRRCHELGLDVAVVMGADDQMDPDDMAALLAPLADGGPSYSKGDRLSHPDCRSVMPLPRRFGNCCLTFLTRLFCGLQVTDSQCGYTALKLDCLWMLPLDRLYPRYGFPNDMLAAISGAGLTVADVVVRPVYDDESSGIRPVIAMFVYPLILVRSGLTRVVAWRRSSKIQQARKVGTSSGCNRVI